MDKTITLNKYQIEVLQAFDEQNGLATLWSIKVDSLKAKTHGDDPELHKARMSYVQVEQRIDVLARAFAMSVWGSLKTEHAQKINPVETAGEAATEAAGTPWKRF